jgi:hypothetical protein
MKVFRIFLFLFCVPAIAQDVPFEVSDERIAMEFVTTMADVERKRVEIEMLAHYRARAELLQVFFDSEIQSTSRSEEEKTIASSQSQIVDELLYFFDSSLERTASDLELAEESLESLRSQLQAERERYELNQQ